jgi:hypothetical protein
MRRGECAFRAGLSLAAALSEQDVAKPLTYLEDAVARVAAK